MNERILVVDDEESIRQLALKWLKRAGYQGLEAPNALKGLEVAENERPDVVVTDYRMSGMDGCDFAEQLRFYRRYKCKIILMSGNPADAYADHSYLRADFDLYFDAFLQKPISKDKFIDSIGSVLTSPQSQ